MAKLFNIDKEIKVSGYNFLKKNKKLFVYASVERKAGIPPGTLAKILNSRKPAKAHIEALDKFKEYLLHELKNQ